MPVSERPEDDLPPSPSYQAEIDALREAPLIEAGLSPKEASIANKALHILESPQFSNLVKANEIGEFTQIKIDGYIIEYQPDLPKYISGMTAFGDRGFMIGPSAFSSREETVKTIFQETFRLNTRVLAQNGAGSLNAEIAASETDAARAFADKAFAAIAHK